MTSEYILLYKDKHDVLSYKLGTKEEIEQTLNEGNGLIFKERIFSIKKEYELNIVAK